MSKDRLVFAPSTKQYEKSQLLRENLDPNPIVQFNKWYQNAIASGESLPESVTLSTASLPSGRVSARVVLFKELDLRGFIVFSNWHTSKKNADIRSNPQAALTFFWKSLEQQVRIEGHTEFISQDESLEYFRTRPRESRIGAHASPQSQPVLSRQALDDKVGLARQKFEGVEDIPLPEGWGGLRIVPTEIEFWQGRANRVHDRFTYKRENEDSEWAIERLAP
ncbi:hypothetical protein V1514DRAFT_347798 [Lipomyces japonicus]|uniref:uncharacterized protein n=1 Tax=Lipomyces japonicus TaxID=56871 RepID=UPI0034CDB028